jgi:hypothetical protein
MTGEAKPSDVHFLGPNVQRQAGWRLVGTAVRTARECLAMQSFKQWISRHSHDVAGPQRTARCSLGQGCFDRLVLRTWIGTRQCDCLEESRASTAAVTATTSASATQHPKNAPAAVFARRSWTRVELGKPRAQAASPSTRRDPNGCAPPSPPPSCPTSKRSWPLGTNSPAHDVKARGGLKLHPIYTGLLQPAVGKRVQRFFCSLIFSASLPCV